MAGNGNTSKNINQRLDKMIFTGKRTHIMKRLVDVALKDVV